MSFHCPESTPWQVLPPVPEEAPGIQKTSLWSQLFGCNCALEDDDLLLCRLQGHECQMKTISCERLLSDDCEEDAESDSAYWTTTLEESRESRIDGLRGMHPKVTQGAVLPELDRKGELESLMRNIRSLHDDLFVQKGWELECLHDDKHCMYSINKRRVRVFSLPSDIPVPDSRHLRSTIGSSPLLAASAKIAAGIIVNDGPLKQPLFDYLLQTGVNEHYDARGTENPTAVTGAASDLEFFVPAMVYAASLRHATEEERFACMEQAARQADLRHAAANRPNHCKPMPGGLRPGPSRISNGSSGSVLIAPHGGA